MPNPVQPHPPAPRPAAERVLGQLKLHGPQSAAALGRALKISGEAARQQLHRLMRQGLVAAISRTQGVGRPVQLWQLTAAGHGCFPDKHAALLANMLHNLRETLGEDALNQVLDAREAQARLTYLESLAGARDLDERISMLAGMRTREGYMCEVRTPAADTWLLIENHCPICVAAASCAALCSSELHLFRSVLGTRVTVERTEHLQTGGQRCAYRIRLQ